jgi:hypothetical protein
MLATKIASIGQATQVERLPTLVTKGRYGS